MTTQKLMVYWTISLLTCIGKVVEKVVAELLPEHPERRGLLSKCQYGRRKRRSAMNAAAIKLGRAHGDCDEGNIAGILVVNIKPAFRSIGSVD